MIEVTCPCGVKLRARQPQELVTATQQHCTRTHGTQVPVETILAAASNVPKAPKRGSRLMLEIASAIAEILAERSNTKQTSTTAGPVTDVLTTPDGAVSGPAQPAAPRPVAPKPTQPPNVIPKHPTTPPNPTLQAVRESAASQARIEAQAVAESTRKMEQLKATQKKMNEEVEIAQLVSNLQNLQHQINMGIIRNIHT